ncbi:zinc-binding alcohol dehydrogenase family protein [Gracilibacillus oryzae]|uniref:Zinc-binding alcohol dehydrogenase family protein n=1 Tax=Gracilibacillus oryzae TaxID=1672701 RepID=A0A7C8KT21_9BACI|nr:zinc-binding alcohol dehydrogenase family protein [Gracilibacillus oryzae]KAB8130776.1 zinc-binding alcohol dehydrogenase family protein [Gracilibacillus oryzae]
MQMIVCEEPGSLTKKNTEAPVANSGEAIIRIKRIGICGTDIHAFKGNQPFFHYPRVLGHELAGIIDWIEESTSSIKKGDQVTIIPYLECGKCAACKSGKTNCCTQMKVLGVHLDGGMCEQLAVPVDHLIKTNGLSLDETAVIEPLSIGAHAIRRSGIQKGDHVLVIGSGPIGLGVMLFAKQEGATVIAMDIDQKRLTFCREWAGVDNIVNALESPEQSIREITNGDMPAIVFDATGNRQSMNQAFHYPAHGGKLVYVGLVKDDITFFDPDFHAKELTLLASRNATKKDFEYVLRFIQNGNLAVKDYITNRTTFDHVINTFDKWIQPDAGIIKAMVEL